MITHYLNTPLTQSSMNDLRAGDRVYISGRIITLRDEAHKRICDLVKAGKDLPVCLKRRTIYYTGPAPAPDGKIIGSAGPTSSYRMDPYTPDLLKLGVNAVIGKGERSDDVRASFIKNKAVYLAATGGAAVLISKTVKTVRTLAYPELGHEAIREMQVEDFPCIVAYDAQGGDIYAG
ncbi:MAG: FumA C-terminus/TtdB family hydratase beta subunit [Candidatus Delongbacteria bacterium]